MPTVAALVCANRIGKSLITTLQSICSQDYKNIGVALHLDGVSCTDIDLHEISVCCRSHGRLSHIYQSSIPVGLTKGLILLQQNVPADYYARLDVGDLWHPQKISRQIELCLKFNYAVVGTRSQYVDPDYTPISMSEPLPRESSQLIHCIRSFKGLYDHSSILFAAKYKYDQHWFFSQDMKLYVDIANSGGHFGYIPDLLTKILYNPSGITLTKRPLQLYYEKEARKRLFCINPRVSAPKSPFELRSPSKLFCFFYRNFVLSMYTNKPFRARLFLLAACLSDMRLFTYYADRVLFAFCKMLR
jgi:hypothetical protein